MAELRWILLLAGLAFLAALAAWESRRPRQARRDALNPTDRGDAAIGDSQPADASASIPMPSIPMRASFNNPRVPVMVPTRVELPPLDPEDVAADSADHLAQDMARDVVNHRADIEQFGAYEAIATDGPRGNEPRGDEPMLAELRAHEPGEPIVASPELQVVLPMIRADETGSAQPEPVAAAAPPTPIAEPIVDWPPESQRHVISVRVVGVNCDRMSGRPLRQALAACGFVHGRFGIFHQPGVDGRALVSAANLNKPGVFDPGSMDFQRFRGLGLFAVLPGPLPPAAALDHLLDTAGDLAQRLHARLLDEQGEPLDEERLEALARTVHDMSNSMLRSEPAA